MLNTAILKLELFELFVGLNLNKVDDNKEIETKKFEIKKLKN